MVEDTQIIHFVGLALKRLYCQVISSKVRGGLIVNNSKMPSIWFYDLVVMEDATSNNVTR